MSSHSRSLRSAAALAVAPLALLALPPSAQAADRWSYRSTSEGASAEWTEYGELPGIGGNVHVGFLEAQTSNAGGDVYGKVFDYACDPGEVPGGGGHDEVAPTHGEEPQCDLVSKRFIKGGDVTFTVDRKLQTARLTGTLLVDNHGAEARPPVNMTWTGIGELSSYVTYEKGTSDGYSYVYKYERTSRDAAVTGAIGPMGFTDDADDESSGSIDRTKSYERGRSS